MALRTIADLPALDVESILEQPALTENLAESLFEISYMESVGQFDSYKSRHVRFGGLSNLMMYGITNSAFDFHGYKMFLDGLGVVGDLNLSGSLYVNKDNPNWTQYDIIMNAGTVKINSLTTDLCAQ